MRITFWTHERGGCAWYRSHEPRRALASLGHEVSWTSELSPNARLPEILHAQRLYNPPNLDLWKALKAHGGCKLVYDIDDDLFNVPSWSPASQVYGRPEVKAGISAHLEAADAVIVSTRPLVHVVRQHTDAPVHVLPNTVPEELLKYNGGAGLARGTVGWAGSDTHSRDWTSGITKAVRNATKEANGTFTVIGAPHPVASYHIPWQRDIWDYYRNLQSFGVGLAPLTRHVFNDSKSHIKILEYMALGIPFIASPEPPYRVLGRTVAGFLAESPREWGDYIRTLLTDSELYWQMSRAAKDLAEEWTTERHAKDIEHVFASVL